MGIHIVNIENGKLRHDYVESYEELSLVEFITKDSIVYQGEEEWKPTKISESKIYKHFSEGWFRAGIQAQELFKKQATKQGFILEELNQDQKSFKSYTSNANNIPIKRGDFLIRNFGNIEVDVKCRGFRNVNDVMCFDFKMEDAIKHTNMQKFTNTPILIAIYENQNNSPLDEKVYFFSIDRLVNNKQIKKHFREGIGECFRIPIKFLDEGFGLIKKTFEANFTNGIKTSKVTEDKPEYNLEYEKWTPENDEKLKSLYYEGYSINRLSIVFGENNFSIRARIKKLGLNENTVANTG